MVRARSAASLIRRSFGSSSGHSSHAAWAMVQLPSMIAVSDAAETMTRWPSGIGPSTRRYPLVAIMPSCSQYRSRCYSGPMQRIRQLSPDQQVRFKALFDRGRCILPVRVGPGQLSRAATYRNELVVYALVSPTGRAYVGQTRDLQARLGYYSRGSCRSQPRLFHSIDRHGFDEFLVFVLARCSTLQELSDVESNWTTTLGAHLDGMNCMIGGSVPTHSVSSKKKMSRSTAGSLNPMWGKTHSPEARQKISAAHLGAVRPPSERARLRALHLGKPKSPEHRKKISKAKCVFLYTVTDPQGTTTVTHNLKEFCRSTGASEWGLGEVARDRRGHSRGWTVTRRMANGSSGD